MSKRPRKNHRLAERAAPIRAALSKLIHRKIKNRHDREALASFLGQGVSSVNNMIYSGEGGLDSWIGALEYCYRFDPKAASQILEEVEQFFTRTYPRSRADQLYAELSSQLDDDQLTFLLSLVKASIKLNRK